MWLSDDLFVNIQIKDELTLNLNVLFDLQVTHSRRVH